MKRVLCLFAFCTLLLSCIKEKDPDPQLGRSTNYTLNVHAVKGGRPDTKALSFDGLKLKATWAKGEEVRVYTGQALFCTLQATTDGESTILSGTAPRALKPGDELRLEFLSPDYKNQEGTLDYIATHCDYATARVAVSSREETTISTTEAVFETRQAIVAFHLVEAADPSKPLAASSLDFNVAGESIAVTPTAPASEVFVAVPAVPGRPVSLTATAGDKVYALFRNDVKLDSAVYYVVTAKMHEAVSLLVHNEAELVAAVQNDYALIQFANDIAISNLLEIKGNRTVAVDMCGFKLDRGSITRSSQAIVVRTGSKLHLSNGGTVTITGGYVYAKGGWEYGAGIGGGQDGKGANVTITGGTVVAQGGEDKTGRRAIGPGTGSDDYGSLTLGDNMMVSSERMANVDERKNMCWYRTRVRVEPCTHPGHTAEDCPYHKRD